MCSDFEHEVWSRLQSWSSCKILRMKFGQHFAADAWLRLWSLILFEILRLGLVNIVLLKLSTTADVWLRCLGWCLIKILSIKFDQDLCKKLTKKKLVTLVSRTQPRVRCAIANVWILILYIMFLIVPLISTETNLNKQTLQNQITYFVKMTFFFTL